ncbi:unnamed protein product [Cercospora beticola]|nr:unnamed protein product [Cercospora beticola]
MSRHSSTCYTIYQSRLHCSTPGHCPLSNVLHDACNASEQHIPAHHSGQSPPFSARLRLCLVMEVTPGMDGLAGMSETLATTWNIFIWVHLFLNNCRSVWS